MIAGQLEQQELPHPITTDEPPRPAGGSAGTTADLPARPEPVYATTSLLSSARENLVLVVILIFMIWILPLLMSADVLSAATGGA